MKTPRIDFYGNKKENKRNSRCIIRYPFENSISVVMRSLIFPSNPAKLYKILANDKKRNKVKQHSSRFLTLVEGVRDSVQEISVDEVKQAIDQESLPFYLIDVREESEWHAGHLPHAFHLSKGVIERDIEKIIPEPNVPLVLYCSGGFRSALAAASLQKMGYTQVCSMAGGCTAWKNAGYPMV